MSSQHEEAYGRLLLHATHTSREGFEAVVICADDTDVFILCLAFKDNIHASLFQKCGTRLIDISNMAASVGPDVCKALLGLHAFTGCDTASIFAGKGKIHALTIFKANAEFKEVFAQLGVQWSLAPNLHVKFGGVRMEVRPQAALMNCGTICSVPGKVMQNHISYLPVKTASESIPSVPNIKLQSGEGA